jgi:signal transduction histidine kinase
MNLLTNAAKDTDPGVKSALTLGTHAAEAVITLTDTGRGIEPR